MPSTLPQHFMQPLVEKYGEDAVRLAVNSSTTLTDFPESLIDQWSNKVNQLWNIRRNIVPESSIKASLEKSSSQQAKRVVILHGRSASPDMHFYPWLKQAMLAQGFEVLSPHIEDSVHSSAPNWNETLTKIKSQFTSETTVVAHSMAALAFCRFLQDNSDIHIKAFHSVAGVFNDFLRPFQPPELTEQIRTFDPEHINHASIHKQIDHIHLHHSTDDSRVVFASATKYLEAFGVGKLHSYENRDHFLNQPEFPELAEAIVADYSAKLLSIILDFDGVLGDTWEATFSTRMAVSRMTKPEAIEHERSLLNKPYHAKDSENLQEKLADKEIWQKQYRNTFAQLRPQPFTDFIEALKRLNNVQFAIVSSSEKQLIEQVLKESGLEIPTILDYKHHYSKEEKVLEVCENWNIPASDAYYITDTVADVHELKHILPLDHIIGCGWGYSGAQALLKVLDEKNVLMAARDIFSLFSINPLFLLSDESEQAYRQVQAILFDEDTINSVERLEIIKNCIDAFSTESLIAEPVWVDLLMAIAPFAPIISQELWSELGVSSEVPFIHESV